MTCRVKIDLPNGVIELEGEATFVSEFFERFSNILSAPGFGRSSVSEQTDAPSEDEEPASNDEPSKPKVTRKRAPRPPKGHSCRDRINSLVKDGYFVEKRSTSDIVSGLEKKGWTHTINQVGAALTPMFNAGEILRTKEGGGFKYFWDRD